ncbi:MAG: Gfo/Idh/MocA family oxidoreductase [Acidobacteria bacterium]|nr:Gfo/Idh/MocA family oxidoreductase [Acidobacteriota bacterium]
MIPFTRRDFARRTALVSALSYSRILGANDRIRVGHIGLGNQGATVHSQFLECRNQQTAAVCDLQDDYMDLAVRKAGNSPPKYQDYRKLLDQKDVDAVVIATPDHWHALMFVHACLAGKDVYIEKPLSLTVVEGRKMVETAERTSRVTQSGIYRRSQTFLKEAAGFVRSGGIGHVTVAKSYHIMNDWPNGIGRPPDSAPPDAKKWDQWVGPAPMRPYNPNRTFYNFRWFYDYSGGQLTNFGVHHMDVIRWCLGQDSPRAVTAMGGRYTVGDNREIPDTMEVLWQFDGPTMVVFSQYNANASPGNIQNAEIELRGTKGTMFIHGTRSEVVPEKVTEMVKFARSPLDRQTERAYGPSKKALIAAKTAHSTDDRIGHCQNFLDCIRSRAKCNADVLSTHLSTSATLIANIAYRTRSYLEWDGKAERFTNNAAANQYLSYNYREPYRLP